MPQASSLDPRAYAIAFALLPGSKSRKFREGVERHGSAAAAFQELAAGGAKADALERARHLIDMAASRSIELVVMGEAPYPSSLLELHNAPELLTALGDTSLMKRRCVGIVGTRHASASGERIARAMAELIVRAGAIVVSGMAFGIDAAAHRGALDAGGGTIAVLGSGVDVPYPPKHRELHQRIVQQGLVLSEAPIGTRPILGAFPRRNRIIAALSETLIVIEAGERSGALITARDALELGRNVAAVPGPIDSARNVGSNRLLADGAAFIGRVEDVLHIAELESAPNVSTGVEDVPLDDASQDIILKSVRNGVSDIDVLVQTTTLEAREFTAALSALELAGRIKITASGVVVGA